MATSSVTYGTGVSTAVGTTYLDGLVSGLNTTDIIDQLAAVRGKAVDRMNTEKTVLKDKLTAYQTIGAALGSLQLRAKAIASPSEFMPNITTVSDKTALAASADETAQAGTHTISISHLAEAHKIASGAVSGSDTALGYAGDIVINGETISVQATWTLADLRTAINKADCGVSAGILTVGPTDSRLILEADATGLAAAIDLVDANSSGILSELGLVAAATGVKHAVADGVQSDGLKAQSTPVASAMDLTSPAAGTITINGQDVAIDLATDSLSAIADKINGTAGIGATASIVTGEVDGATVYSLQIVGDTGTPTLDDNGTGVLTTLGVLGKSVANEVRAAADAQFVIDGFAMTRSTNSVDDAIQGVSVQLTGVTTGTETFTVARDVDTAVGQVQELVNTYNSLLDRIESYTKYDSEAETGGLLSGDRTLSNLVSELRQTMTGSITGTTGGTALVSSIGIRADGYDRLSVDTSVLSAALQSDPDVVARMFGFDWASSTSEITYISSTDLTADSGVSGFVVEVSQVATKSSAASAALTGGITVDETLTFAGSGSVTLTAGMTLDEAANALNAHFQDRDLSLSASVEGDTLKVEHNQYGSKYSFAVVSSLDQGVGGTDLGGATAGETQNWANGRDVAGTINGELCSGSGQFLTGRNDNLTTSGLMLKISATTTGTVGTITLGEGAAKRMSDYLGFSLDSEWGAVTRATEAIETEIEEKEDDIATAQARIQVFIDEMRAKFTRMETLLGQAQTLQDYLTGQLASLPNNYMPTK